MIFAALSLSLFDDNSALFMKGIFQKKLLEMLSTAILKESGDYLVTT
jgi:hypothetical protein